MMKINKFIKLNQLLILLMLAVSTTALNISTLIGSLLLLATICVMFLPLYIKDETKYDLFPLIKTEIKKMIGSTKEGLKRAEEQRIKNQQLAEENRLKMLAEEHEQNVVLATANIPLEARELLVSHISELEESDSQLLYRALANKPVEQGQLLVALNNLTKEPREAISSILEKLVPVPVSSYEAPEVVTPLVSSATSVPDFKMKKSGTWINWFIFISGLLMVLLISSFVFGSQLSNEANGGAGVLLVLFIVASVINAIYYLPSLIYHASTGGKIVMFIINSLLGITVIGWIFLLVFAISRNSNEKRSQELMHYIKHK